MQRSKTEIEKQDIKGEQDVKWRVSYKRAKQKKKSST